MQSHQSHGRLDDGRVKYNARIEIQCRLGRTDRPPHANVDPCRISKLNTTFSVHHLILLPNFQTDDTSSVAHCFTDISALPTHDSTAKIKL